MSFLKTASVRAGFAFTKKFKMINDLSSTLGLAGFRFTSTQINQFDHYFKLLSDWNRRINLTSIDEDHYLSHHLLDSLSVLEDLHGDRVLDLGTGGGLPGVVLAVAKPQIQFTLLDARNKKITFLKAVKSALSLSNVDPVHSRVETHKPALKYSSVVTRAFASLDRIFRLAQPVLAQNGRIIAMKGRLSAEEIKHLDHIGVNYEVKSVEVYGLNAQRHSVIIYKDQSRWQK